MVSVSNCVMCGGSTLLTYVEWNRFFRRLQSVIISLVLLPQRQTITKRLLIMYQPLLH